MTGRSFTAEIRRALAERLAATEESDDAQQLMPVCSWCERIRTHGGRWLSQGAVQVAEGTMLSHGLCESCLAEQFPAHEATTRHALARKLATSRP